MEDSASALPWLRYCGLPEARILRAGPAGQHPMQAWFNSELQPLCRTPLFVSSDPDEVKRRTAGAFKEHELHWRAGRVDAALYGAEVGALSFFVLQYGAAVHIEPGQLQG